jgi:hypothetical protein
VGDGFNIERWLAYLYVGPLFYQDIADSMVDYRTTWLSSETVTSVINSFSNSQGCDRIMLNTIAGDFVPLGFGDDERASPTDVVEHTPATAYAIGRATAAGYSAARGLSYPWRSSIFRGIIQKAIGFSSVLEEYSPHATVILAAGHGLKNAGVAAYRGECR